MFDWIDPLLGTLRLLLPGGSTAFIALCTMRTLLVTPRARHVELVLDGVEAWLARFSTEQGFWVNHGVGAKIVAWFEAAVSEDPGLLSRTHSLRVRIDAVLDRLIALGIAEAHELEA